MYGEKLKIKLRTLILENEGDRDDIYQDVLDFMHPFIIGLLDIHQPFGVYSKDPLQQANNTIKSNKNIAAKLLDSISVDPLVTPLRYTVNYAREKIEVEEGCTNVNGFASYREAADALMAYMNSKKVIDKFEF